MNKWSLEIGPDDLPRTRVTVKGVRWNGKVSNPRLPRKNDLHSIHSPGRACHMSPNAQEFRVLLAVARGAVVPPLAERASSTRYKIAKRQVDLWPPLIADGFWALHLRVYVPRSAAKSIAPGAPYMDSDACLSSVKDALEWARVLDNDMRVREDHTRTELRPRQPGMSICLVRLSG